MADLEELERRKRELELQRDIDRLERNERLRRQAEKIGSAASGASAKAKSKLASWGWGWVSACALFGAFLVFGGLHDGALLIIGVGAVLLLPLFAKLSRGQ
jgi:hypothetical protein